MPSSTVEDYAKQIFLESQHGDSDVVPMGRVAGALAVSPGTATTMAKSLAKAGLADYEPRAGLRLTEEGRILALRMLRRHRLIEYFLVEVLEMDWAEIHVEAEALEHAVSDRMLEKLDAYLGHPKYDPHGDPIPNADGLIEEPVLRPLSECPAGTKARVARIQNQDTAFLNFAQSAGLVPGAALHILKCDQAADCMELRVGKAEPRVIGLSAAARVLVRG